MERLRDRLRAIPTINEAPRWDPGDSPEDPYELFISWLDDAIEGGAPVPHAVTLSTVDEDGSPDARVVVLKDVTRQLELGVASGTESAKGRQLSRDPRCALTFYWPAVAVRCGFAAQLTGERRRRRLRTSLRGIRMPVRLH
jgi:pyridoxamine 5'-phosphate oxidase